HLLLHLGHDDDHRFHVHAELEIRRAGEVSLQLDRLLHFETAGGKEGEQRRHEDPARTNHQILLSKEYSGRPDRVCCSSQNDDRQPMKSPALALALLLAACTTTAPQPFTLDYDTPVDAK